MLCWIINILAPTLDCHFGALLHHVASVSGSNLDVLDRFVVLFGLALNKHVLLFDLCVLFWILMILFCVTVNPLIDIFLSWTVGHCTFSVWVALISLIILICGALSREAASSKCASVCATNKDQIHCSIDQARPKLAVRLNQAFEICWNLMKSFDCFYVFLSANSANACKCTTFSLNRQSAVNAPCWRVLNAKPWRLGDRHLVTPRVLTSEIVSNALSYKIDIYPNLPSTSSNNVTRSKPVQV